MPAVGDLVRCADGAWMAAATSALPAYRSYIAEPTDDGAPLLIGHRERIPLTRNLQDQRILKSWVCLEDGPRDRLIKPAAIVAEVDDPTPTPDILGAQPSVARLNLVFVNVKRASLI